MNCQKRTVSFLFSIMTLSACGGLDGTTSVDDGAFGESELETMEQALSRESGEGEGLAAAIPAKGKIGCQDSANIYSNATQADKDCEIEYSNTCGDASKIYTRPLGGGFPATGPVRRIQMTPEDSTADMSIRVPAGSELVFKCCAETEVWSGWCKYESVCVAAETQDDAK